MPKFSPLSAWLARKDPLSSFIDLDGRPPEQELGGFLSLDVCIMAHETIALESESLATSWRKTHEYVSASLEIISTEEPLWLDSEEVAMIREELGEPPPLCYPIYLITVAKGEEERLVYVGKTSSNSGRFKGGHAAFTKLLAPNYDGWEKRVYLGGVVLLAADKSYQPLEWVKPLETAERILSSIEAQLIHSFKPELNSAHVLKDNASWPVSLHIQNFSGKSSFLHDEFCWPNR
jgi:hypothetical protein